MQREEGNGVATESAMNSVHINNTNTVSSINDSSRHRWAEAHRMMWMPNAECPPTTSLLGSDSEEHENELQENVNSQQKEMADKIDVTTHKKPEFTFSSSQSSSLSSAAERSKSDNVRFSSSAIVLPHDHLSQTPKKSFLQEEILTQSTTPTKKLNRPHGLLNKLSNQILMACYESSSSSLSPSSLSSLPKVKKGNGRKPLLSNTLLSELKEVLDDETTETYVKNLITAIIALSESRHDEHEAASTNDATRDETLPATQQVLQYDSSTNNGYNDKEATVTFNTKMSLQRQQQEEEEEQREMQKARVTMAFEARDEMELILKEICKRLGCTIDTFDDHNVADNKNYKQVYCNVVRVIEECNQRVNEIKQMYCYSNCITANNDSHHVFTDEQLEWNRASSTNSKLEQTTTPHEKKTHEIALESNKCTSLRETVQETHQLISCHSSSNDACDARAAQRTLSEMVDILESYGSVSKCANMPSVLLRVVNELEQLRRSKQFDEMLMKEYEHSVHDRFAAYGEVHPPCVRDEIERLVHVQATLTEPELAHNAVHGHATLCVEHTAKTQNEIWLEEPLQKLLHDISLLSSSMESIPSMEELLLLSSYSSSTMSTVSPFQSGALLFTPHDAQQTRCNVFHAIQLAREALQRWNEENKQRACTCTCTNNDTNRYNDADACKGEQHQQEDNRKTDFMEFNGTHANKEKEEKEEKEATNREQVLALNTVHELINAIPLSLQIKLNLRSSDCFTHTQAHMLSDVVQSLLREHLTQEKVITMVCEVNHLLHNVLQTLKVEQGTSNHKENTLMLASSLLPVNTPEISITATTTQHDTESVTAPHKPLYAPLMSSIHELQEVSSVLKNEIITYLEHVHDGVYTASQAEVKSAVHKLAEMLVMGSGNLMTAAATTTSSASANTNTNSKVWPSSQMLVEPPSHKLSDMIALVHACWVETVQSSQRQQLQLMHVNAEKTRIQRNALKYTTEMSQIMNEMCGIFAKLTQTNNNNNLNSNNDGVGSLRAWSVNDNVEGPTENVNADGVISSPSSSHLSSTLPAEPLQDINGLSTLTDNLTSSHAAEYLHTLTERLKMLKVKSTRAVEQLHTTRVRVESLTNNANTTQRRMRKAAASLRNICHTLSIPVDNHFSNCSVNNNNNNKSNKSNTDIPVISEVEMIRLLRLIELRVRGNDTLQENSLRESKMAELEHQVEMLRNDSLISSAALKALLHKLQADGEYIKMALYVIGTDESPRDDLLDEIERLFQAEAKTVADTKAHDVEFMQGTHTEQRKPDFDVSVFSEMSSEDETQLLNTLRNKPTTSEIDERVEELLAMLIQKYTRWTQRLREGINEHLYTQQKITRYVGAMCQFINSAATGLLKMPERRSKIPDLDLIKLTNLIDIDDVLMQCTDNVLPELDRILCTLSEQRANKLRKIINSSKRSSSKKTSETEKKLASILRSNKSTQQQKISNEEEEEELLLEEHQSSLPPLPSKPSNKALESQKISKTNEDDVQEGDDDTLLDVEDVSEEISQGDYVPFRSCDILPYDIRLEKLHEMMIKLHTILSSLHRVHYLAIPVAERVRRSGDVELIFDDSEDVTAVSSIYDKFCNTNVDSSGKEKDMRQASSESKKTTRTSTNPDNEKVGFVNVDLAELIQSSMVREMKRAELDKMSTMTNSNSTASLVNLKRRKPDKFARESTPPLQSHSLTSSEANIDEHADQYDKYSSAHMHNDEVKSNESSEEVDNEAERSMDSSTDTNSNDVNNDVDSIDTPYKLTRLMNNEIILKVLTHNAECLYNSAKKFSSMYKSAAIIIQKDTDAVQSLLSSMLERYSELDVERAFQQNRNELLAMYSVLSEKGTRAKGCYFFTRVNGEGPCVWTAALEKLNAGFGTIIDKLVERTELITRYRGVIDHVSSHCLEYVNWAVSSPLPELQLPSAITDKCSSTENDDNNHVDSNHVNGPNHVEDSTNSESKDANIKLTQEGKEEYLNVLPPMPAEMPTLTPLEKLLAESCTTVKSSEHNDLQSNIITTNATASATNKEDKNEVCNSNVTFEVKQEDNNVPENVKFTRFTEDDVLASVVRTLLDQLKLFVAHYTLHDMPNKGKSEDSNTILIASMQEELHALAQENKTLEDERDKALSSAAVARTELRRWLRQSGLSEESVALLDKTHALPTTSTTFNTQRSSNDNDKMKDYNGHVNVLHSPHSEVHYSSSVSPIITTNNNTITINHENRVNSTGCEEMNKIKENSAEDQLQVMLSPPTEVTPIESHSRPLTHTLYNHLASLHVDEKSISPPQLEAIRQYLCALNEQLQFAEMAIGRHKKSSHLHSTNSPSNNNNKPTGALNSLPSSLQEHYHHHNNKLNRSVSQRNRRKSVEYESDSDTCSSDYMEPATTSANIANATDTDLVVTPSPHRYAVNYNLRQEQSARKRVNKERDSKLHQIEPEQQHRRHSLRDRKQTREQESQRRSSSSARLQRERPKSVTPTPYRSKSSHNSRSIDTDRAGNGSSAAKMHNCMLTKQKEQRNANPHDEVQKKIAVRRQIEKNRHFPPSRKEYEEEYEENEEEEEREKQHEYNVRSLTPKRNVESHSHASPSHTNYENNKKKDNSSGVVRNKESKMMGSVDPNNLSYFKLTPSETRRLLRQSHSRSPDDKYQPNILSMPPQQQERSLRKESSINKSESSGSKHNESNEHGNGHIHHQRRHHRHNSNVKRQEQPLRYDDYTNSIGPDLF